MSDLCISQTFMYQVKHVLFITLRYVSHVFNHCSTKCVYILLVYMYTVGVANAKNLCARVMYFQLLFDHSLCVGVHTDSGLWSCRRKSICFVAIPVSIAIFAAIISLVHLFLYKHLP